MTPETLEDLFWSHLQDLRGTQETLLDSIIRVLTVLPHPGIEDELQEYMREAESQAERLERMLEDGARRTFRSRNSEDRREQDRTRWRGYTDPELLPEGLIIGLQFLLQYTIAAHGAARNWANMLGYGEVSALLQECLDENERSAIRLSMLAQEWGKEAH